MKTQNNILTFSPERTYPENMDEVYTQLVFEKRGSSPTEIALTADTTIYLQS